MGYPFNMVLCFQSNFVTEFTAGAMVLHELLWSFHCLQFSPQLSANITNLTQTVILARPSCLAHYRCSTLVSDGTQSAPIIRIILHEGPRMSEDGALTDRKDDAVRIVWQEHVEGLYLTIRASWRRRAIDSFLTCTRRRLRRLRHLPWDLLQSQDRRTPRTRNRGQAPHAASEVSATLLGCTCMCIVAHVLRTRASDPFAVVVAVRSRHPCICVRVEDGLLRGHARRCPPRWAVRLSRVDLLRWSLRLWLGFGIMTTPRGLLLATRRRRRKMSSSRCP
jgi:hypothetical protein